MNLIESSRTKNTSRNILYGIINKILNTILPFITRTILIYVLGNKFLGLNALFTSVLQVLNLAELGFSSAIIYSMYKPVADNDIKKIGILLNFYKKVYRIMGIVILTMGFILLPFIKNFISGDYPAGINIYVIYLINLTNTCLTYFLYAYKNSLLIASQREDIISKIASVVLIIQNIIQMIILLIFKNYYLYIITLPLCTVFNNLFVAFVVKKRYPEIKEINEKLEKEQSKELRKQLKGMIFRKVGNVVLFNTDYIVISSFLGLETLGIYSNYYYVITALFGVLTVIVNSLKASVGNSIITETKEKNFNDLKKFTFMYLWIISFCTISLLCLFQNFIYLWGGKNMLLTNDIVILFGIYFFIYTWFDLLDVYLEALGLWWESRYMPAIASIINLTTNIILIKTIGLKAVLLSTIISYVFVYDIGYVIVLSKSYFKKNQMKEWILKNIKYLFTTTVVAIVVYNLCNILFSEYTYINLVCRAIICLTVINFLLFLFYRKQKECKEAIEMIKTILKKFLSVIPDKIELKKINRGHDDFQINRKFIDLVENNKNAYIEKIEEIQLHQYENEFKWVGAVEYNNKIYFIPNGVNDFLVYDLKKEEYSYIPFNYKKRNYRWTGGFEYLGKIYTLPRAENILLSLDVSNHKIEKINLGLKYKKEHHYGGVQTENGIIYQPPRYCNHILKIDIKNKAAKKIYISPKWLNIKYTYNSGILHPNGNIYFFPQKGRRVMILNVKTEEISFIGKKISTMVFDATIGKDGNIYGFSKLEKGILKIDVKNKTSEMIHTEIGVPGCYGTKLGINGKIYGIPGDGNIVYEYDIEKDEVKEIYQTKDKIKAKCAGGVVTKDGTIYTVPALGNTIYKYCFKNVKEEISEELLNSCYYRDNY